ncbi:hypothetical protein [Nevskia soli]|uniref:hypothetical protein n=1 Tax=Nevskia soli TaxID=418856 RepID=UPI0004A6FF31|nr:hypothetical protein [Nevskia soli]
MARLPGPLKRKSEDADLAQRLRAENLTRLRAAQGAAATPAPVAVRGAAEGAVEQARAGHAEVAAPEAPEAAGTDEVERLRSRVSTSEGMLRAENDRHRQAEDAWRRREAELLERMSVVQRQAAAPLSADELRRYVTPQQLQEFGEEHCRFLVETVRAASGELTRGAVQEEVAAIREELRAHRAELQRSKEAGFWAAVNAGLPRWREINANAEFLKWLNERDPLAGRTRQEVLNEARGMLDADRVLAIFNAWGQSQQRPSGRDASRRVIPNGKPSASLPSEAPAETVVSRAWIAEQNRLYSQGHYRRRPQEWQAIQETIDRAAGEGRIR